MTGADELERILREGREVLASVDASHPKNPLPPGFQDNLLREYVQAGALSRAAVLFGEHSYDVGIDLVMLAAQAAAQLAVSALQDPEIAAATLRFAKDVNEPSPRSTPPVPQITEAEIEALCQDTAGAPAGERLPVSDNDGREPR